MPAAPRRGSIGAVVAGIFRGCFGLLVVGGVLLLALVLVVG